MILLKFVAGCIRKGVTRSRLDRDAGEWVDASQRDKKTASRTASDKEVAAQKTDA